MNDVDPKEDFHDVKTTLQSILLLGLSVFNNNFTFSCCEVLYSSVMRGHVSRVVNS